MMFIIWRGIHDGWIVSVVDVLKRKREGFILKLDFEKEYDIVD